MLEIKLEKNKKIFLANNAFTYMQPVEYRFVEEFPHTPIGKVDFRMLEKEAEKL